MSWDIYSNGDLLNTIVASDETAIARYCKMHGYTYKERRAPSESDIRFINLENENADNRDKVSALEAENKTLKSKLTAVEAQMSASVAVSNSAFVCLAEQGGIAPAVMAEHVDVFAAWAYPVNYKVGNIRQYSGKLYKCLQDHTSQEAWTPDTAPSLWVAVSDPAEEWPEWVQPVASTDAYPQGAKVTHSGKRWTSDVAANVWEPGVYGWTEAE